MPQDSQPSPDYIKVLEALKAAEAAAVELSGTDPEYRRILEAYRNAESAAQNFLKDPTSTNYRRFDAALLVTGVVVLVKTRRLAGETGSLRGRVEELVEENDDFHDLVTRLKEQNEQAEISAQQRVAIAERRVEERARADYGEKEKSLMERLEGLERELLGLKELQAQRNIIGAELSKLAIKQERANLREEALKAREGRVGDVEEIMRILGSDTIGNLSEQAAERLESMRALERTSKKISSGDPQLDAMLLGGFERGSSVMVLGGPYSGREIIANSFASASVRSRFPTLYVTTLKSKEVIVRQLGALLGSLDESVIEIVDARSGTPDAVHEKIEEWYGGTQRDVARIIVNPYTFPVAEQKRLVEISERVQEQGGILLCVADSEMYSSQDLGRMRNAFAYTVSVSYEPSGGKLSVESRYPIDPQSSGLSFQKVKAGDRESIRIDRGRGSVPSSRR